MSLKKYTLQTEEISVFCMQINYCLRAGIPLCDGAESIAKSAKDGRLRSIMEKVAAGLNEHMPLSAVLRQTEAFPEYMCNMVEIGDTAGKSEEVMSSLSDYYERENVLAGRLKNAVMYPAMLFCLMSIVVAVLVFKVLPMFEKIFRQLGGDVSMAAGGIMYFGIAVGTAAIVIVGIALVVAILLSIAAKTKKGKAIVENALTRFPPTRSMTMKMAARRFASAMALMLSGGVGIKQAMEMTAGIMNSDRDRLKINVAIVSIDSGTDVAEAILKTEIFPDTFSRMIDIGIRTGAADEVMKRMARVYEEEIDRNFETAMAIIEPAFVGTIAVVIGMILIAVILPLTGVMAAIG